jgi:hypothetical protein
LTSWQTSIRDRSTTAAIAQANCEDGQVKVETPTSIWVDAFQKVIDTKWIGAARHAAGFRPRHLAACIAASNTYFARSLSTDARACGASYQPPG